MGSNLKVGDTVFIQDSGNGTKTVMVKSVNEDGSVDTEWFDGQDFQQEQFSASELYKVVMA